MNNDWIKGMAKDKEVDDYIVTRLSNQLVVDAVRYAFCTKAKEGDMIVVAILKPSKKRKQ